MPARLDIWDLPDCTIEVLFVPGSVFVYGLIYPCSHPLQFFSSFCFIIDVVNRPFYYAGNEISCVVLVGLVGSL